MKIFIATGIYPPEVGGPAEYASNLKRVWEEKGFEVSVGVFSRFNFLPTGFRHLIYFYSILFKVWNTDVVLVLDTYSAALPAVFLGMCFRKKVILRTGGDFLWETYVERTGDLIKLSDFYKEGVGKLSQKEKIIFKLTRFILKNVSAIVWSTKWQKDIFISPYGLEKQKHFIVENYYGEKLPSATSSSKVFFAGSRKLKLKNLDLLEEVFKKNDIVSFGATLDTKPVLQKDFLEKIRESYAVIVASIGDISPNTILAAIRCNKPFIVTTETGIYERIKDIAIFVDPKSEEDVAKKILWLCEKNNYDEQENKIKLFNFTHSWEDIAGEFLEISKIIE